MAALLVGQIRELLADYYPEPSDALLGQLSIYLDLLMKWNARMNLTAIREPEEMVRRHFGESLFAARHLPACETLLDLGSGAGFPGIPMQLALPWVRVTLAECQSKKVGFLREVVRVLGIPTEIWPRRIEEMPEQRRFDVVALRAVDNPEEALRWARLRVRTGGRIAHLAGSLEVAGAAGTTLALPGSSVRVLHLFS